jgi:hypothetical protein
MIYSPGFNEARQSRGFVTCNCCNDLFTNAERRQRILSKDGYEWRRALRDIDDSYKQTNCPLCGSMCELHRSGDLRGRLGDHQLIFTFRAYSSDQGREGISHVQISGHHGFERLFEVFTSSSK